MAICNRRKTMAQEAEHITAKEKKHFTPLILRLTRRAVTFLFTLLAATICFYIAGCAQNFLDSNISLLLFCITSISILVCLFSAAAICECIAFLLIFKRIFFLLYAIPFFILTSLSIAIAMLSNSLNLLAHGI